MAFYISKEELEQLYYDEKISIEKIAALKGTSRATIGRRCKEYGIKIRHVPKTHAQFIRELKQIRGSEYEVLGEYKGTDSKILVRHRECGFQWEVYPRNLLRGHGCPLCAGNKKLTIEQYIAKVKAIHGEEYSILGQYRGMNQKISVRHNRCGYVWDVLASNLIQGQGCPNCRGKRIGEQLRKNHRQFIKEVYNLVGCEYSVLSLYETTHSKVTMKHNKCGHIWEVTGAHFLSGTRCPKCAINSVTEDFVYKYLKQNNIEFEYQVSFNGCRNKKLLLFDFKIYTTSGFFLLELDGEQHYVAMANWGGEEGLRRMQKNDRIKEEYCKKNNIKLIRVPYWEFDNIEEILKRILESEGGYKIA